MPSSAGGQLLPGGVANRGSVFRVGDTVRRPTGPHSTATHDLLRHLSATGFTGSPRLLTMDGAVESLSWIPGQAARNPLPDWALEEDSLISVARLVRRFHDAAASFGAERAASHRWPTPVPARHRTVALSHNDLHPGNVIFVEGRAVGLIDFDLAGPGGPIWDLATLARGWGPLVDERDLPAALDPDRRFGRLALLLDAYGLAAGDRMAVVRALVDNHDWTYRIVTDAAGQGHPGFSDYWRSVAAQSLRDRAWLISQQARLQAAVR